TGYGICSRRFDPAEVAAVGRCRERDRYLAEGHVGARADALGAELPREEPLLVDACLGRSDLQPDPQFAEVPSYRTESADLGVVGGWRFTWPEDVAVLEARGLLRGPERVTRTRFGRNVRQLLFADNLGLALAVGRSIGCGPAQEAPTGVLRGGTRITAAHFRILKAEGELGVASLARSACQPGLSNDEVGLILQQLGERIRADPRSQDASSSNGALEKLLVAEALPELNLLTLGEHAAVRSRTEAQYAQEVHQYSGARRVTDIPIEELDSRLVQYIDHQIRRGVTAARGMKLLAGVVHARPTAGKQGPRALQRSWRDLGGWRNLSPSTPRLPEAWPIWCAIENGPCSVRRYDMALFIWLMWSTHARPIQLMALKPEFLFPSSRVATHWALQLNPEIEGVPSKAKEYDVTTEHDHDWWASLTPVLRALRSRPPGERVRTRGGWKSDRSVVRYEKGARLSSTWMAHPMWLPQHAGLCEEKFVEIVVRSRVLPKPALHCR
ncbi:unnamed protein product, partial [Prorocentrum cordatum]